MLVPTLHLLGLAASVLASFAVGAAVAHLTASSRGWLVGAVWTVGAAAVLGAIAVLHTGIHGVDVDLFRPIDSFETTAAALLPLVALLVCRRAAPRHGRRAGAALASVLVIGLLDAVGATHLLAGWLPGIGVVRPFDRVTLASADYCSHPINQVVGIAAVGAFCALLASSRGPRLRGLRLATLAGLLLFAASMLTRGHIACGRCSADVHRREVERLLPPGVTLERCGQSDGQWTDRTRHHCSHASSGSMSE